MIDCTVLVMTYNEEANIDKCLTSIVGKFSRICMVDSSSDDKTVSLAKNYSQVELFTNQFTTFGEQRNWLLKAAAVDTKYILFLDADESISDSLANEIACLTERGQADFASFPVQNIFLGRVIKYAYGHPNVYRLFRTSSSPTYVTEGARDYPIKIGIEEKLKNHLLHEDRKPLEVWLQKHILNAQREAAYILDDNKSEYDQGFKTFIREQVWFRLPVFMRPLIYFFYRYILRGGILDGSPGFIFCFFQAYSYQTMIAAFVFKEKNTL